MTNVHDFPGTIVDGSFDRLALRDDRLNRLFRLSLPRQFLNVVVENALETDRRCYGNPRLKPRPSGREGVNILLSVVAVVVSSRDVIAPYLQLTE